MPHSLTRAPVRRRATWRTLLRPYAAAPPAAGCCGFTGGPLRMNEGPDQQVRAFVDDTPFRGASRRTGHAVLSRR
jgi:hypothetical protein